MPVPDLDIATLSIDERLRLMEALWDSIERSAANGDAEAVRAVQQWTDIDSELVAALEREADDAERDPASLVPWEDLLAELKLKRR